MSAGIQVVRLFDYISFDSASWQVAAVDGTTVALKNLATGRIRKLPILALLGDESYLPDQRVQTPPLGNPAFLETLPNEARARVEFLYRHVVEVLTGQTPGVDDEMAPLPQCDPSLPMQDRVDAKLEELAHAGTPMGRRTLLRYMSRFRQQGIEGLADGRGTRTDRSVGQGYGDITQLLREEIADQRAKSTFTKTKTIAVVTAKAVKAGIDVPSKATFYRIIDSLDRQDHPFGDAKTRRTQALRPDRARGGQAPLRPGELVEIDGNYLDVFVLDAFGKPRRAELTAAVDVATRTIIAAIIRPESTKAVDAAVLLARALTPLPMQPGWPEAIAFSRSILPAGMIQGDDEARDAIAARPLIWPENVTIDRGKVFVSATFIAARERLQIGIVKAAPRTPDDKGHIERWFGALNAGFTQYLEGYKGMNVIQRGDNPEEDAVWPVERLQDALDLWLVGVWQNRPHAALHHPAIPAKDLTPNEMYAALFGVAPSLHAVLTRDDYISLLPVAYRKIEHYGVNMNNLHYAAPQLREYAGMRNSARPDGKWEVRFDPYRADVVFVHVRDLWIEATWTLAKLALAPFSADTLKAAKDALKRRGEVITASAILEHINRIQTGLVETKQAKSAVNRTVTVPIPEPEAADEADARDEPSAPAKDRRVKPAFLPTILDD